MARVRRAAAVAVLLFTVVAIVVGGADPASAATTKKKSMSVNGAAETLSFTAADTDYLVSFSGLSGQSVGVTTTAGTFVNNCDVQLTLKQGATVLAGPVCGGQAGSIPATLLTANTTFDVLVDPQGLVTGSLKIQLTSVAGPKSITPGAKAISFSVPASSTTDFGFIGKNNQLLSELATGTGANPCSFTLSLVRPNSTIAATDLCAGDGAFLEPVASSTGTWKLRIANATGTARTLKLSVAMFKDVTGAIATNGTPLLVNLAQPGQRALKTFSGTSGQKVSVVATGSTIPGCYSGSMSLVRPDTTTLTSAGICNADGFLDAVTLDATGTWTLMVDPTVENTGKVTVALYTVTDQTGAITPDGPTVGVSLTTPGQNARFTFTGTAGQVLRTDVTAASFTGCYWGYTHLLRPDGTDFFAAGICNASGGGESSPLDVSGTWTVTVDPIDKQTGTATLALHLVSTGGGTIPSDGTAVTATIANAGDTAEFTFTGTTGQSYSVLVSNSTIPDCYGAYLNLVRPDGTTLAAQGVCNADGFLDATALDASGTWKVVLDPIDARTGSADLQLWLLTDQTGTIATNGTTVPVALDRPGERALFTFSGTSGQRFSSVVSSSTFPGCYSGYIYLLRPDGSWLTYAGVCTDGFIDSIALDVTGTWTVMFDPVGTSTGTANVQLYLVTDQTGTILTNGTAKAVTLTTPGQRARFTFSGTSGQLFSSVVSNSTFPGCNSGYISLVRPDGTALTSAGMCNADGFLDAIALDATGTWTLMVDPDVANSGTATLKLFLIADQTGTILTNGTAKAVTLTKPGQNARFTFSGTSGQRFTSVITSPTFPGCYGAYFVLVRPDGSWLNYAGTCGTDAFIDATVLDVTGTWTLMVDPIGTATGTASVKLYLDTDQTGTILTDGTAKAVSVTTPGQRAAFTFSGTTGQQFSAVVSSSTFPGCNSGYLSLVHPDGTALTSAGICNADGFLDAIALDATGTWTVLIDPAGLGTGTASVQLYLLADQTGTILTNGATKAVSLTTPGQNARFTFSGTSGQRFSSVVSSSTFPGCYGAYYALVRPDGSWLTWTGNCGTDAFIDATTLDATGTWTYLVDPIGTGTGTANVQLYQVVDQTGAIALNAAKSVSITAPGQRAVFTFSATNGQSRKLSVTTPVFNGNACYTVSFYRPDASYYTSAFYCGGPGTLGPTVLDTTGTWSAVVDPDTTNTGTATLTMTVS